MAANALRWRLGEVVSRGADLLGKAAIALIELTRDPGEVDVGAHRRAE